MTPDELRARYAEMGFTDETADALVTSAELIQKYAAGRTWDAYQAALLNEEFAGAVSAAERSLRGEPGSLILALRWRQIIAGRSVVEYTPPLDITGIRSRLPRRYQIDADDLDALEPGESVMVNEIRRLDRTDLARLDRSPIPFGWERLWRQLVRVAATVEAVGGLHLQDCQYTTGGRCDCPDEVELVNLAMDDLGDALEQLELERQPR